MGISPISPIGALAGAAAVSGITSTSSAENIRASLTKLEQQREEYKRSADDTLRRREMNSLDQRIKNLQQRLDRMDSEEQEDGECQTCKNRKYQDGSDDPGVSFKTASKITGSAEAAVRSHEYEHVNRNRAKADREDKEIVYQSVIIKHGICPECGDVYVTGGETTTVTRTVPKEDSETGNTLSRTDPRFEAGLFDSAEEKGKLLNIVA